MRILLINCPNRLSRRLEFFPYGISLLASIGKIAGHEVLVYDCNLNRNIDTFTKYLKEVGPWDLIGLSGLVTTYDYQKTLSFVIRKAIPSAVILSGGGLASSIPELLLKRSEIDVACVGEGESIFQDLLNVLNEGLSLSEVRGIVWKNFNGEIITNQSAEVIDKLDDLPFPDWDASGLNKYFLLSGFSHKGENASYLKRRADLTTTRGCSYRCSFCSNVFSRNKYYKNKYAERMNDPVFKEHLYRYFGTVSFCTPYPGSSIYDEHKEQIGNLDAFMSALTFRDAKEFIVNLTELSIIELIGVQYILSSPDFWDYPNLI